MDDFALNLGLLRALAQATLATVKEDDRKRYISGFMVGLEAAEEVGYFDPPPTPKLPPGLNDPFLLGAFDGRVGDGFAMISRALG